MHRRVQHSRITLTVPVPRTVDRRCRRTGQHLRYNSRCRTSSRQTNCWSSFGIGRLGPSDAIHFQYGFVHIKYNIYNIVNIKLENNYLYSKFVDLLTQLIVIAPMVTAGQIYTACYENDCATNIDSSEMNI